LEQAVAGWQRHQWQFGHIPRADNVAPAVWVALDGLDHIGNLIDLIAAIPIEPASPLCRINWPKLPIRASPFIPYRHAILLAQIIRVCAAGKEPQEFAGHRFEVDSLRRNDRKAVCKVKSHLIAERGSSAGSSSVGFRRAVA